MFNSRQYWEKRYQTNQTSGSGSYHHLAIFKADVMNDFFETHAISSVIDYGMGDGNQLKLLKLDNIHYTGIDVSKTIVEKCKKMFVNDPLKNFILDTDIQTTTHSDVVLSCDVLFHLIEDDVYKNYMNNLFTMAKKYVIIYARDEDLSHTAHVKFRKFTTFIHKWFPDWVLIRHIPNQYPQNRVGENNNTTSPSEFYIYENFEKQRKTCSVWETYIQQKLLPLIHDKLEGNIYSRHLTKSAYINLLPKRYNILNLFYTIQPKKVLEIGFNSGFSSLLMKMSSIEFDLTCIDINDHDYVVPCFEQIRHDYPKIEIMLEPSHVALQTLINNGCTFDIIHIDGDHSLKGAKRDLELCLKLSHKNTIIIFDDTNLKHLSDLCQSFIQNGFITPYRLSNFIECKEYKHSFYQIGLIPLYVSCTSIFQNQHVLEKTLQSILEQTRLPTRIFVYLSQEPYLLDQGFPDKKITYPPLYDLIEKNSSMICVEWVENDGSYRKLLPLLKKKWKEDCFIATIDDDTIYHPHLLQNMIRDYNTHKCVVNYRGFTPQMKNLTEFDYLKRAKLIKKNLYNFATGKGCILYKPQFFHKTGQLIFQKNIYRHECQCQDDVWFYLLRILNHIPCYIDNTKPYMSKDLTIGGLFATYNRKNNQNTKVCRQLVSRLFPPCTETTKKQQLIQPKKLESHQKNTTKTTMPHRLQKYLKLHKTM